MNFRRGLLYHYCILCNGKPSYILFQFIRKTAVCPISTPRGANYWSSKRTLVCMTMSNLYWV